MPISSAYCVSAGVTQLLCYDGKRSSGLHKLSSIITPQSMKDKALWRARRSNRRSKEITVCPWLPPISVKAKEYKVFVDLSFTSVEKVTYAFIGKVNISPSPTFLRSDVENERIRSHVAHLEVCEF